MILIETTKFNLLSKIVDNLEIYQLEENNEDPTDGFVDKVKEIIKEIFDELKDRLNPNNKEKGQSVRAIVRIFSILLNTKANSTDKSKKIVKESANLALELWPARTKLTVRRKLGPMFVPAPGHRIRNKNIMNRRNN